MRTVVVASSGGDYVSLNAAETGEDGSLADDLTIQCSAMTDTAVVTWAGWTQNGFSVTVEAASGAGFDDGIFTTTGRYLLDCNNAGGIASITHSNASALTVTYKNIQVRRRGGSSFNFRLGLALQANSNVVYLDGCYFEVNGASQALPTNAGCVNTADAASRIVYARNCVFKSPGTATNGVVQSENGAAMYLHNCVVDGAGGAGPGVNRVTSGTVEVRNSAVFNTANDFNGTITVANCASDDGDGTNAVTLGTSTEWNAAFTDYANGDWTIKDASSPLYNAGADLSANGNYAVTTDIAGTARPQSTSFDIGISELVVAGGSFTLTADPGAFTITGTAASLEFNREVNAEAGSVAVTGTAASLEYHREVAAEAGSVAITGTDATLRFNREVAADAGAVAISGTDASLEYNRVLSAEPGSVAITGTDATLRYGKELVAEPGAVAVTGTDASLEYNRVLSAELGAVTITGTDASLTLEGVETQQAGGGMRVPLYERTERPKKKRTKTPAQKPVEQKPAPEPVRYSMAAEPGSFAIAGMPVVFLTKRRLHAMAGSVAVTGSNAALTYEYDEYEGEPEDLVYVWMET